jgi:ADP-heptose:LPS heptosyltransferase
VLSLICMHRIALCYCVSQCQCIILFPSFFFFTDVLSLCLQGNYYDMLISTRFAGLGHAIFLSMCDCRQKISYVHPNVNAAGAGNYLDKAIKAPHLDLAEGGYHMYSDLLEHLKVRGETIPPSEVPPLQIGVSKRLQAFVEAKYSKAGAQKRDFLVFHGIESTSFASMQSSGDTDSLLPLPVWATLAKSTSSRVLFVIPNEKDRQKVQEACGEDAHIVFITTPGQLAAVIHASSGVVTTNTAAFQMAHALRKPRVVLFSSQEKADLYLPEVTPECAVIVSKTGKLCDIDTKAAQIAISTIGQESLVAA